MGYGGKVLLAACWLLPVFVLAVPGSWAGELEKYRAGLPFTMPVFEIPKFPDRVFSIAQHGGVPDGRTLNTGAFAGAIRACSAAGGGTVLVPPGTWLTGPIRLESNVNLHVERGALVLFSSRIEDFPLIAGFDGKSKSFMVTPPIHAYRARNIAVTGGGVFDGAGEVWRYVKREKLTERQWKELVASGGVVSEDGKQWWPSREAMEGEKYLAMLERRRKTPGAEDYARVREYLRPDLVRLVQSDGILLDGPTFRNAPKFHLHCVQSENIVIRNVRILTEWHAQNGDGLDLNSCRNVIVSNATVDVGDDGLCLKPGTIASSQKPGPACENIVIADCIVYHAHGGFVIGSESYGGVRNVALRNCQFIGTDVGLRFKSLRGRGGVVEKVFIDGIQMRQIRNEAVLFDMYYGEGDPEERSAADMVPYPVTERTPDFRDITIRNVTCTDARRAVLMNGLPELPLSGIVFDSLTITSRAGFQSTFARDIVLRDVSLFVERGPVASFRQSSAVTVSSLSYRAGGDLLLEVLGEQSRAIRLINVDRTGAKQSLRLGEGVARDAVEWQK